MNSKSGTFSRLRNFISISFTINFHYHQKIKKNKESHWLQVSATTLFGYFSDNIKMGNVNYC